MTTEGIILLAALGIAVAVLLAVRIRRKHLQRQRTQLFLRGIQNSRRAAEAEAGRLMSMVERGRRGGILHSNIDWILEDVRHRGRRALVRARFDHRFTALVGRDPNTGEAFFLMVPPDIRSVKEALEWSWNLPKGFWKGRHISEN